MAAAGLGPRATLGGVFVGAGSVWGACVAWRGHGGWGLGYHSMGFRHFPDIS